MSGYTASCALELKRLAQLSYKIANLLWWVILTTCKKVGDAFGGLHGSLTNSAVSKAALFCFALFPLLKGTRELSATTTPV